jgi:uncharacterized protein
LKAGLENNKTTAMKKILFLFLTILSFATQAQKLDIIKGNELFKKGVAAEDNKDYTTAIAYYEKAGKLKCAAAYHNLAVLYYDGVGVKKDIDLAIKYYKAASDLNFANSQVVLGGMYENGEGVVKSQSKANELCRKAAAQNNPQALLDVALIYYMGKGEQVSLELAFEWMQKAADYGSADAMYNLGNFFRKGIGVKASIDDAIIWYKKAAEYYIDDANLNLGQIYADKGKTDTTEFEVAAKYYQLAVKQGNAAAHHLLSELYYYGKGVTQSYTQAFTLAEYAATNNITNAQFNLGLMYYNGIGSTKNIAEAKKWFTIAADRGNSGAAEYVQKLSSQ